ARDARVRLDADQQHVDAGPRPSAEHRGRAVEDHGHVEHDRFDARDLHARPSSLTARTAVWNAASVSAITSSVWHAPTRARAPLKSTPFRISAWRNARLCSGNFPSRRRQSTFATD